MRGGEKGSIPSEPCPRRLEIRKDAMALMLPEAREYEVRDVLLPGFVVRVSPKGLRTFAYRWSQDGKDVRANLGRYPALPVAAARKKAEGWFGMVAQGRDPRREKLEKQAQRKAEAVTMGQLLDRYLAEYLPTLKDNTQRDYKSVVRRLKVRFGTVPVLDFGEAHAQKLHQDLAATPREANKQIAILSGVLLMGETWKLRALHTNPCHLVARYPENKRVRSLTPEEAKTLGGILLKLQLRYPKAADMIRLILLTGARPGELEVLEWPWVDLKAGVITVPREHHKTGRTTDEPRYIGLGPLAITILKRWHKQRTCRFVFPGDDATGHYTGLHACWQRMRRQDPDDLGELAKAGLLDVHMHDLRHTWATWARRSGILLEQLPDMLGHTTMAMSRRYAHAQSDQLRLGAISVEKAMRGKLKK